MKNFIVFSLVIVAMLASCQDVKHVEKPENLISEDEMVDIITDLTLASSARNYNHQLFDSKDLDPESWVYEKYGIDSLQLKQSSEYYSDNYTKYEDIYTRVKERLEGLKDNIDSIFEEEKRVEDSINQAKQSVKDSLFEKDKSEKDTIKPDSLELKEFSNSDNRRRPGKPRMSEERRDSLIAPPSIP